MSTQQHATIALAKKKCISLTTFKRDGSAVSAPVWFNVIGDTIAVTTPRDSWKVKRIERNPRVEFAACTQRGRVTGATFAGTARILPDHEYAPIEAAKKRRYVSFRIIRLVHRDQVAIEITPDT